MKRSYLPAALLVGFLAWSFGFTAAQDQAPDTAIFMPVQEVGNTFGARVALYGCTDKGATVSSLTVWATASFMRGMQVNLTDGTSQTFGCLNTTTPNGPFVGCLDADIQNATFTFEAGESIVALQTWTGLYDGPTDQEHRLRAGALAFGTSWRRTFDGGMSGERGNPTQIDVGSGILCGVYQRAGSDIDSIGLVFLQPVTAATIGNISYTGVPSNEVDVNGLQVDVTNIKVANATLDNAANLTDHTYTSSDTMQQQRYTNWSRASGLDSWLTSTVIAGAPNLSTTTDGRELRGWRVSSSTPQDRIVQDTVDIPWQYNVTVPGGGIDAVTVTTRMATISGVPYTADLEVQLTTGGSFMLPVQGVYEGVAYSPIVANVTVVKAPPPPPPSSSATPNTATQAGAIGSGTVDPDKATTSTSNSENHLAVILGVLLGVLACLVVIALVVALLVLRRRRNRQDDDSESGASSSQAPSALGYVLPWGVGKGGGSRKRSRDVPPSDLGLPDPKLAEGDVHGAQPLEASRRASAQLPNPKEEGLSHPSPTPAPANRAAGDQRETVPYSVYRSLRLDSIRTALGLGKRSPELDGERATDIEMKSNGLFDPKGDASPKKAASQDKETTPPSGLHWGYPVPTAGTPRTPQKSSFHQSCDPVLQSQQAASDKYEAMMSDTTSTADGTVASDLDSAMGSRPPTRGSEAPSEVPAVGDTVPTKVAPTATKAPLTPSKLNRTASPANQDFVEPKFLRPGDEDDDSLLVEPTHKRIRGFGSRPPPPPEEEGKPKVVEHEDATIKLGGRRTPSQLAEPSGKQIVLEDTPVALGSKYRAPEGSSGKSFRSLLRLEDADIKLGSKYQTQGRNE